MKLHNLLSSLDYSVLFLMHFNRLTLPLTPLKLVLLHAVLIFFFFLDTLFSEARDEKKCLGNVLCVTYYMRPAWNHFHGVSRIS